MASTLESFLRLGFVEGNVHVLGMTLHERSIARSFLDVLEEGSLALLENEVLSLIREGSRSLDAS